jgi:hypothetical protein
MTLLLLSIELQPLHERGVILFWDTSRPSFGRSSLA